MQVNSPTQQSAQSAPLILATLPDPEMTGNGCPRRARAHIDWLLLALEALDLGGSEAMLVAIQELQLQALIPNRVALWRLRTTNPFRRMSLRRPLGIEEAKALVAIACALARRQTVVIRQLLLAADQLQAQQLALDHHFYLGSYLERFRSHFRSRMNMKRTGLAVYSSNEQLNELALALLGQLLFCTGTAGMGRFWSSLFDGEVA